MVPSETTRLPFSKRSVWNCGRSCVKHVITTEDGANLSLRRMIPALENPNLFLSQACGIGQARLHIFKGEVRIFFENLLRAQTAG